jgi:hypothetical protein
MEALYQQFSPHVRFFACDFWGGNDAQCDLYQDVAQITFPVLLQADGLGAPDMYNCSYHYVFVIDGQGIVQYRGSSNIPVIEAVLEAAVDNLTGVPVEDVPGAAPLLGANYPNPFNPSTRIPYQVPGDQSGSVRLEVLDLRGRVVRTLVDRAVAPGEHVASFDGRDAAGNVLPSGSYLARLRVDGREWSRVMTLVK